MNTFFTGLYTRIRKANRLLVAGAMFLISGSILGGLLYSQRDVLLSQKWEIHWSFIGLAFAFFCADLLLVALIWGWILNTLSKPLPLLLHVRNYIFSNLAKRIPGTLWYIAGRSYLYNKEGVSIGQVSLASSVELAVAILSGILVSIVFALPQVLLVRSRWYLFGLFAILSLVTVHPGVIQWVLKALKIEQNPRIRYRNIILWLLAYTAAWILGGLIVFAVSNSLTPVRIQQLPFIIGSWSLAGVISASFFFFPSNLGITEVSLSLLLSQIMPASTAVLVAVLTRIVTTLFEVLCSLACLIFFRKGWDESSRSINPFIKPP